MDKLGRGSIARGNIKSQPISALFKRKIQGLIDEYNLQITKKIDEAMDTGRKIDIKKLFKDFKDLQEDARLTGKAVTNIEAIQKIRREITEANNQIGRKALTAREAQRLKKNIYSALTGYYKGDVRKPKSEFGPKAQASVARQAKLFLEEVVPGIKQLNRKDGDLINLMKELDRPVSRIENLKPWSGLMWSAGAGGMFGMATKNPELAAVLGLSLGVLSRPKVSSRLAIIINKMEKAGIDPGPNAKSMMVMLEEMRKAREEEQEQ